nr:unnamed protein product [Callosobruchus analis]
MLLLICFQDEDTTTVSIGAASAKLRRFDDVSPEKTPKSRWRRREPETYLPNKRKVRRSLEKSIPVNHQKWFMKLVSWALHVDVNINAEKNLKGRRKETTEKKRPELSRKMNAFYNVNVNSQNIRICKTGFLNAHGLESSHGRINRIVSRKVQDASVPDRDQRGRSNQLSDEEKQHVRDHINLSPK